MIEMANQQHLDAIEKKLKSFFCSVGNMAMIADKLKFLEENTKGICEEIIKRKSEYEKYLNEEAVKSILYSVFFEDCSSEEKVNKFMDILRDIPQECVFKFPFMDFMPIEISEYKFSENVWVKRDQITAEYLSRLSGRELTNYNLHRSFGYDRESFIFLKISGANLSKDCSDWIKYGAANKAISIYKRIIYLCLIGGDFDRAGIPQSFDGKIRFELLGGEIPFSESIDDSIFAPFYRRYLLEMNSSNDSDFDWLKKSVEYLFSENCDNALILAIDWAIEAEEKYNHEMGFIAYFIALEAILSAGADMNRNAEDRLSDRLAYILGKDRSLREEYADRYFKISKKRNDLVHGKTKVISLEDFTEVQYLTKNVILSEFKMFLRE